ncbi:MAG: type V CRISPR-associated protein Cas12k [Prochloraceae cyanobacterium]|nr:type V CRISPR-associated protein Cas12k [Prochloraceae cyanobacterium]
MNQITIQCRLVATEETRHHLWGLMAEKNTPLINELLRRINDDRDFEEWQSQGKLPVSVVSDLCKSLKTDPLYEGQPSRFYLSTIKLVNYIYKSWLKLQRHRQQKLEGLDRWLSMLKSDIELLKECERSLDILRKKAKEILTDIEATIDKSKTNSQRKRIPTKSSLLFDLYDETEDSLIRCAICYLLKNGSKLPKPDKPEDSKKFAQRRRKVAIKIERLTDQIEGSRPHGRDLTGEEWLLTLITAATTVPKDDREACSWQDTLLTKPKSLPFPIIFETNEDLKWHKNEKGRLCVRFNGLSKHTFEIYCDRRQLHWFQRFLEDQQIKKEGKDSHSSGLFTLRSAQLAWKQDRDRGEPWNANRLVLYCTVDTRFWSAERTEQVRQEKETELLETITKMKDFGELSPTQQAFVQRKRSTLAKLNNPFPRPSHQLYQGKPNIVVGVAMGLDKPATVVIVDRVEGKAIAYRNIKQLLGKNYRLLNRQRQQKQTLSHQRHKAQKRSAENQMGESKLGQHLDRLIAKATVELAKKYQASLIVVPKLEDMREIVQSEVKAKAEVKIPGYEEGQKKYAKQYRINIHNWSYGRLIDNITTQAKKLGIVVKQGKQSVRGSPMEKAENMATLV